MMKIILTLPHSDATLKHRDRVYASKRETRWEMPAGTLMETRQIYHTHAGDNSPSLSQHTHICQTFPQKRMGGKCLIEHN